MSEKKTPVEILMDVLDEQYKLFDETVKDGAVADILDISGAITKTAEALMNARQVEIMERIAQEREKAES